MAQCSGMPTAPRPGSPRQSGARGSRARGRTPRLVRDGIRLVRDRNGALVGQAVPDRGAGNGRSDEGTERQPAMEAGSVQDGLEALDHAGVPGSAPDASPDLGTAVRRSIVATWGVSRSTTRGGTRTVRIATRPIASHATTDADRRLNSPIRT